MRPDVRDPVSECRRRCACLLRFAGALVVTMVAGQSSFADMLPIGLHDRALPPPAPDRELPDRFAPIPFAAGEYSLDKNAKAYLGGIVAWLKANPDRKMRLEGHSADPGTDEYNLAVGEKRANSVLVYMVAGGIAASRLTTVSYGRFRPLSGNGNLNSRVELVIGK